MKTTEIQAIGLSNMNSNIPLFCKKKQNVPNLSELITFLTL